MSLENLRDLLPQMPGQDKEFKQIAPVAIPKGGILASVSETLMTMHLSHVASDLMSEDELKRERAQDRVERLLPYMTPKKSEIKVKTDEGGIDQDAKDALQVFMKERQALAADYEVEN